MSGIDLEVQGGSKLSNKLRMLAAQYQAANIKVGLPASSGTHDSGMSFAKLGAIHEFGEGNIPERSFLRIPLAQNKAGIAEVIEHAAIDIQNGATADQAMAQVGSYAVGVCQDAIADGISPALKPSTIAAKDGKATPLINTGALRGAITYVTGDE